MRSAWRLATRSLRARPRRTALLIAAVALSALLIAAVATAMASIHGSIAERITATIGRADVVIQGRGSGLTIDESWLDEARSWPGVRRAEATIETPLALRATIELYQPSRKDPEKFRLVRTHTLINAMGHSVLAEVTDQFHPLRLVEGRLPTGEGEIAIDTLLADRLAGRKGESGALGGAIAMRNVLLDASQVIEAPMVDQAEAERHNNSIKIGVGDSIEQMSGFLRRKATVLRVVGIVEPPPLGGRPQAYVEYRALASLAGMEGRASSIEILLEPGVDAEAFVRKHRTQLDPETERRVLIQTTAVVTSGLNKNMESSRIGMVLASAIAFLSASFIIMTGMTVDVSQRQRELAVLRCIGGKRAQLAMSQLLSGLFIGAFGAIIGTPLGIALCGVLIHLLRDQLRAGLVLSWSPVVLASGGAIVSGLIGALWPAWRASRTSPLRALSPRTSPVRRRTVVAISLFGLLGIGIQLLAVGLPNDGNVAFYAYVLVGLPAMFIGYFLLGVPMILMTSRVVGPVIGRMLRMPPRLFVRTIEQTPFRFGFTAGAMMGGLALMVSIWVHGGAIMRDWLGSLKFPDAFVSGLALSPEAQHTLDQMPFVQGTCAITLLPIETDAFGIKGLTRYRSTFIAFEPERFFELAEITFVEGDLQTAKARLEAGGAVIVAREFQVARGLGVGDPFVCYKDGNRYEFEIVGVVTSPGLDIVSKFFNIGEEYTDQAIHAVFGSRKDLISLFGTDAINLIQVEIDPNYDDAKAIEEIRRDLFSYGILDAGSGRAIKRSLKLVLGGALGASTIVGICAMIVACFGVANLIAAGIDARRFEFGVLRSIGAQRGMLLRLVVGEALMIAVSACVLGTAMGFQGAYAGRRLYKLLLGVELHSTFPVRGVLLGWVLVTLITVLAAIPAGVLVMRTSPRDLLTEGR